MSHLLNFPFVVGKPSCLHTSCSLHAAAWLTLHSTLTPHVFEVDGLSVGVEQLDDGVVVVLHSAADGGHFPLDHRHVVSRQVLTFNFPTQAENTNGKNYNSDGDGGIYSRSNIYASYNRNSM